MTPRGGPDRMRSIGSVAGMLGRSSRTAHRQDVVRDRLADERAARHRRRLDPRGRRPAEAAAQRLRRLPLRRAARATRRVVQNKTYSAHELGVAALRLQPPGEPAIEAPPMAAGRRLKYKLEALRWRPRARASAAAARRPPRERFAGQCGEAAGQEFCAGEPAKSWSAADRAGSSGPEPRAAISPIERARAPAARDGGASWFTASALADARVGARRRVDGHRTAARHLAADLCARQAAAGAGEASAADVGTAALAVEGGRGRVAAAEEGVGAPDVRPGLA